MPKRQATTRRIVGISARQDFFELLRRIEWASHSDVRLGEPGQRQIRIYQPADMSFAPREVADVRQPLGDDQTAEPVIIICRHFGLFAPYGPLPIHITEHARNELLARRNRAFQDFAGILSQRMAILHYRAWSQLHVAVGHDHKEHNRFKSHIHQIAGLLDETGINRHILNVREAFPGAYLPGRGSLRKLQEILTHYFSVPVRLTPHKGTWINDARNQECQRMGYLGSTRIGKRFFDAQHSLSVAIGPVIGDEYLQYQRGSERLKTLVHLCHDFIRHRMVLDVSILIQTSPDMACRLRSGRLGKHSWLKPGTALTKRLLYKTTT
ncbi:ImpH/VasB family protein [Trabulsiella guamensis ATCC 49490]|uniref:ImpH/VasB family protein n=1 Tax=Trabulsiella guamensis ATCC 49490 TaxID=1005994 RepID=A0A084ZNH4_9ENTR|nr:type VI secretion system baseplate subunit TssG [Trabulsiella guamensis]KFB99018.1 ImpH/VasB family protein [Trabulsiella guamensis ATCC 49490]